jgi:hypothetical protein
MTARAAFRRVGVWASRTLVVRERLRISWLVELLPDRYAISSGYALHHVPNVGFGESNPGLNAHLVYVKLGITRFDARP